MKKVILSIICVASLVFTAMCLSTACNKDILDTTWKFDYAYIKLPTGDVVQGKVVSWTDFDDGDQIQITVNGKTYLTHISNVVLVSN